MKRVMISAYACQFGSGSEPGAGYLWSMAANESAEVELITRPLDKVTRGLLTASGIKVHELRIEHNRKVPQLSYIKWLFEAQKQMKKIHHKNPFDLVHHVTYATDWLPSPKISGIPLIWGPVGGSTGLPNGLASLYSRRLRRRELLRAAATKTIRLYTQIWAFRHVTLLLAQNQDTAQSYRHVSNVQVRPNCVVPKSSALDCNEHREPKSIAIVGRLIEMKGVHIALQALASDRLSSWKLHIIGDGPKREELVLLTARLGLVDRVIFHGHVERENVQKLLSTVTCSLLLSTHDAAGWSAAESISLGTPVITWSHGGPAELVQMSDCGIALSSQRPSLESLVEAICNVTPRPSGLLPLYEYPQLVQNIQDWHASVLSR